MAGGRSGIQVDRVIASTLDVCNLATPWSPVYATDASGRAQGGNGVTRRWCDPGDAAATGSCAERWGFLAEEFNSARRSALVELDLEAQKASWLGVEDIWEAGCVDLHPSLAGDMRESFHTTPVVFENVPSTILQPKSAWCVLFGGVLRKPLEILQGEGKAYVMGLRHACRSTECLGKRLLLLLNNMALVLGASKGRGSTPNLNHTCREVCVISLATFTIPVCRWIASESNPADEPSRSKRYRPRMHSDVDQCGPSASGSAPDVELLAVLSAEAARVASEEAQARKQSASRPCAGAADLNEGRTDTYPKTTRRRRSCTRSSPKKKGTRVVLPRAEPSRRNHGSGLHRHGQQVSGLLRKDEGQAEGVGKVGRDGNARRGPCSMGNYSRNDVCGNGGERRGICSDDCCPIRGMLAAQRVVRPDGWSAHSSSAGVRRKQLGHPLISSGRGEGLEYG